jgi:hypothetical protein
MPVKGCTAFFVRREGAMQGNRATDARPEARLLRRVAHALHASGSWNK